MDNWVLGIDFGTSFIAAAARIGTNPPTALEIRGTRRIPSVVMIDDASSVVVGHGAEAQALVQPTRVLRAVKSRLGDPAPIIVDRRSYAAVALVAEVLAHVYREAVRQIGSPPASTHLTHPAVWGRERVRQLAEAARRAGIAEPVLIPEPVAAAAFFAGDLTADEDCVAVFDLGGGTFDAAVVERDGEGGYRVVGRPVGDASIGGELFDELLYTWVGEQLDPETWELLVTQPDAEWEHAAAAIRADARRAKEALTETASVAVLAATPNGYRRVTVTRGDFDAIVRPYVADALDVFATCIQGSGVAAERLAGVAPIGGSSSSPIVVRMLRERFPELAVVTRGDPKASVAMGATLAPPAAGQRPIVRDPAPTPLVVPARPPSLQPAPGSTPPTPPTAGMPPPAAPPPPGSPPPPGPGTVLLGPPGAGSPPPGPPDAPPSPGRGRWWAIAAAAAVVVLVGVAVIVARSGGGDDTSSETTVRRGRDASTTTSSTAATGPAILPTDTTLAGGGAPVEPGPTGGTLDIAMEFEPDCMDWIDVCAGSFWGTWAVATQTLPRAFDVVPDGEGAWTYTPSILLTGEPELVASPAQVVTYRIDPAARWDDGTPITSRDFRYTWDAIAHGDDIYDRTGYSSIASVDDSDPSVAVVTFSSPYADWKSLFGTIYGLYPAHLLEGADHTAVMSDGYDFSGGPWKLEAWNRGVDIRLVPNTNYWGELPRLDRVVFHLIADPVAAVQAYVAGTVQIVYPSPQLGAIDALAGALLHNLEVNPVTAHVEALWINSAAAPFDSLAVRQALAYSLDREALARAVFGELAPAPVLDVLNAPMLGTYNDPQAFAGYRADMAAVDQLMTGDGWARNADGVWERAGQTATFTLLTTVGNARRQRIQDLVQQQAAAAGFDVRSEDLSAAELFGRQLPEGNFQVALYAQVLGALDPGRCDLLCSEHIPSEPEYSGLNWGRVTIAELDPLLQQVDVELDPQARAVANRQADSIIAANVPAIPLHSLPNLLAWRHEVVGPVADNPVLGPFWNLHELAISS